MITFDFETEGIVGNPIFNPPKPVGVSIKSDDDGSKYLAWGHPTDNNTSWEEGRRVFLSALKQDKSWLAHNAPFEAAVLRKWFGVVKKSPLLFHDTQYLLFLYDPYASSFSLKPSAERVLNLPPDEQQELKEWILRNVRGAKESDWGAYICLAPGALVGKYAGNSSVTGAPGDTDRTWLLYKELMPKIVEQGMLEAYRREQFLMPILSESSVRGVRTDQERLHRDIAIYEAAQKISDEYIFSRLGEFDINKDAQLAAALDRADQVTEWVLTPTGKRSVSRKNLVGRVKDPAILQHLAYRGVLETCLGTFARPWASTLVDSVGRVHPQWNQVRGDRGADGDISGARTGRMSCKGPNLQNIPNDFEELAIPAEIRDYFDRLGLGDVPSVMHMRAYLLPEEWHVWLKRDFSAQEMRIFAHYAEGGLFDAFNRDPSTDPHAAVRQLILDNTGIDLSRKFVKITGFGILYGRGVDNLSLALGVPRDQGENTRNAYYAALPEVRALSNETRHIGRTGQAIRTWGGRKYYREPNPDRDLSYKLLNYLIQGSAADQTKDVAVKWEQVRSPDAKLLCLVHDEVNISAPKEDARAHMNTLQQEMDAKRFDVPFQSEGYVGPNWADIIKEKEYWSKTCK